MADGGNSGRGKKWKSVLMGLLVAGTAFAAGVLANRLTVTLVQSLAGNRVEVPAPELQVVRSLWDIDGANSLVSNLTLVVTTNGTLWELKRYQIFVQVSCLDPGPDGRLGTLDDSEIICATARTVVVLPTHSIGLRTVKLPLDRPINPETTEVHDLSFIVTSIARVSPLPPRLFVGPTVGSVAIPQGHSLPVAVMTAGVGGVKLGTEVSIAIGETFPGFTVQPESQGAVLVGGDLPVPSTTSTFNLVAASDAQVGTADVNISVRGISDPTLADTAVLEVTVVPDSTVSTPLSVMVDDTVKPDIAAIPGFDGKLSRPIARIVDPSGLPADFVENEVILSANSSEPVRDFAKRWNGTILSFIDQRNFNLTSLTATTLMPTSPSGSLQFLVRINNTLANTSRLQDDLRALDPNTRGTFRVSSLAALRLLAATASEASRGSKLLTVGINWLGRGAMNFLDRITTDGPGPAGPADTNAYNWPHLMAGGPLNIGATEAWTALDAAGLIHSPANRIRIAILDMGFAPDADFPPFAAFSNVPFVPATGTPNPIPCAGGGSCPWHGTNTLETAMAVVDNGFGAAGVAGPIANGIIVTTFGDMFSSMSAIGIAAAAGARIISMSYGVPVPAILSWSVLPFNAVTAAARAAGILLFASAGNSNTNVDAQDCLWVFNIFHWRWEIVTCWESTWWTPCENDGVICVGAQGSNFNFDRFKASYSNWGPRVGIWAPGTVWVGPDPATPSNHFFFGTSAAAPYAAGVAGLIWSAQPTLTANQVASILFGFAHGPTDSFVNRYVWAQRSVQSLLPSANLFFPNCPAARTFGQGASGVACLGSSTPSSITFQVGNNGPVAAGSFSVRVQFRAISFGIPIPISTTLIGVPGGLASGTQTSFTVAVPSGCRFPTCDFVINLDAFDQIMEPNEGDNTHVDAVVDPAPNLFFPNCPFDFTTGTTHQACLGTSSSSITFQVGNNGPVSAAPFAVLVQFRVLSFTSAISTIFVGGLGAGAQVSITVPIPSGYRTLCFLFGSACNVRIVLDSTNAVSEWNEGDNVHFDGI